MIPVHKIGDVLQINIKKVITSCLVVDNLKNHVIYFNDLALFYGSEEPQIPPGKWFPSNNDLLEKPNFIYEWENNGSLNPCYRLLIGDQKVWLAKIRC